MRRLCLTIAAAILAGAAPGCDGGGGSGGAQAPSSTDIKHAIDNPPPFIKQMKSDVQQQKDQAKAKGAGRSKK